MECETQYKCILYAVEPSSTRTTYNNWNSGCTTSTVTNVHVMWPPFKLIAVRYLLKGTSYASAVSFYNLWHQGDYTLGRSSRVLGNTWGTTSALFSVRRQGRQPARLYTIYLCKSTYKHQSNIVVSNFTTNHCQTSRFILGFQPSSGPPSWLCHCNEKLSSGSVEQVGGAWCSSLPFKGKLTELSHQNRAPKQACKESSCAQTLVFSDRSMFPMFHLDNMELY